MADMTMKRAMPRESRLRARIQAINRYLRTEIIVTLEVHPRRTSHLQVHLDLVWILILEILLFGIPGALPSFLVLPPVAEAGFLHALEQGIGNLELVLLLVFFVDVRAGCFDEDQSIRCLGILVVPLKFVRDLF